MNDARAPDYDEQRKKMAWDFLRRLYPERKFCLVLLRQGVDNTTIGECMSNMQPDMLSVALDDVLTQLKERATP